MKSIKHFFLAAPILSFLVAFPAQAQNKIGYVDSEYILSKVPEYASVKQQVDRLAQEWQNEIETRQSELDNQFKEYQARELLYTNEERTRKREEIVRAEEELERQRNQYFGPEGQLFSQQESLMRPIQEKVLKAIEEIAKADGYDYVFDKNGDFLFMYTRDQYNLSNRVLEELGIEVDEQGRVTNQPEPESSSQE